MAESKKPTDGGDAWRPFIFKDSPETGKIPEALAFKFEGLAQTLAGLALNRDNQTPFTVVVRGSWGRGKTTLLRRTQAILDQEGKEKEGNRQVKTVWFNAWKYPQEDNLLAGLLGEMLAALREGDWGDQLKDLLDRHKGWLARTILSVPLRAIGITDFPEDRYQGVQEKQAFYDHFQELFGQLTWLWFHPLASIRDNFGKALDGNQAVAIFLDDLDRCRPSRVIEVLEAINLFLDQPGVCFFLGLDWERLVEILRNEKGDQSEPFLEKIVQVAFDLPPVNEEGAVAFLERLIGPTQLQELVPPDEWPAIAQVLESRHPRHIKRFLNDLSIRIGVLRNTGHLGAGEDQLPQDAVLSWHLLLEAVPRAQRKTVAANLGNLDGFLRGVGGLTSQESAEAPASPEVQAARQRPGLAVHAQRVAALTPRQKTLLLHLGSPPKPDGGIPPSRAESGTGPEGASRFDWQDLDDPGWVKIPAGTFRMGSEEEEDEKPVHDVQLSGFRISRFPVTNAQYQEFVQETGHRTPNHWKGERIPEGKENHPVVYVSWEDAAQFCAWLSKKTKRRIELPTEAQWEFAARGEQGRTYPWGEDPPSPDLANFDDNVGDTTPVGAYPKGATPEGVHDLAGNVWEWCADWYGPYPEGPVSDPRGPETGPGRVFRACTFRDPPTELRAAYRFFLHAEYSVNNVGFRCVLSEPLNQV